MDHLLINLPYYNFWLYHLVTQASSNLNRALRHLATINATEKALEAEVEQLRTQLEATKLELQTERDRHTNTIRHSEELLWELNRIESQNSVLDEQNKQLLADRNELTIDNDDLRKVVNDLEDHAKDTKLKMVHLIESGNKLEEDYEQILLKGHRTEALQQQIISKYKKSPELTEDIVRQFGEGYQDAKVWMKERMQAASLDPNILDSSDEESEADDNPPINP